MSDGPIQLSAFPDLVPDKELPVQVANGEAWPVPQPEAWVLVGLRSGPRGYHLVRVRGAYDCVVTLCGITGYQIKDAPPPRTCCQMCLASVPE